MALTREIITANAGLSGLSDAQIDALVTMSQNDENDVIAKKTGDIYGGLDADILSTSGVAKNGTEKTYDYAKRVITDMKTKVAEYDALKTKVTELTTEKTRLEKVIKENGADGETKKQLTQAQADLAAVTKSYTDLQAEVKNLKDSHASELFGLRIDGDIAKATAGIKFKKDFSEAVTSVLMRQAVDKIKGMNPEYIDDGKGGKTLVFKGQNGEILRNKENALNPFTAGELLLSELDAMGVIDKGRQQNGTGTQGGQNGQGGQGGSLELVDITQARTQSQAYEIIAAGLMKRGMINGSSEFQAAMSKAWKDNKVGELPVR